MRVFTAFGLAVLCAGFFPKWAAGGVLGHPWSGCPRIYFWDTYGGCQGTYDYITDSSWEAFDASPLVVTQISDEYYCCDETDYRTSDRGCDAWHGNGTSSATCVYADNYCPTLTVDDADPGAALCLGNYTQDDNNAWTGDDPDCTLTWVPDIAGPFYKVYRLDVYLGNVTAHTCNNGITPLEAGLNQLLPSNEDTWYDSMRNLRKPHSGVMTTLPLADSPVRVWVGKEPTLDALVILQLHNRDPSGAYAAVSDTMENSFRVRVVAPSTCPSHTTEDVSFMIVEKGVYTADGDQMAEAGWATVSVPDLGTFIPFTSPFPATPTVLTTIRENTGALQDFIHSRIVSVNATGFTVVLETHIPLTDIKLLWSTDVNFFAIHTNGLITGLFGVKKYFAYVSSPPETITETFQTFTYPTAFHPEYLDTALFLDIPHVFVASQAAVDITPVESRIGSSTTADLSFALREDTCAFARDNVHTDNVYAILALSAADDKYSLPGTTTTTTTTTSTTTTTATTTTTTTTTTTITTTTTTTTTSTTTTTTTSTTTSSTEPPTTTASEDDSSTALIVGVVLGTTAVVAAAVTSGVLYARHAKRVLEAKNRRQDETQPTETTAVDRDQWIEMA